MNSHVNQGSYSFGIKMSSLILSNSSYCTLKFAERNSDAYKPTVEVNSLVLPSKAFVRREVLLLAIRHRIYMKKTG